MRIVRRAQWRAQRWKNGGGVTHEIAIGPDGADMANFAWRVSVAQVDQPGPFSLFAGIDRTLCVLEGQGLTLQLPDQRRVDLDAGSEPFAFAGDLAISAALVAGPILDLNVMSRRGVIDHVVTRQRLIGDQHLAADAGVHIIMAGGDGLQISIGQDTLVLNAYDCLIADPVSVLPIVLRGPTTFDAFIIGLHEGSGSA